MRPVTAKLFHADKWTDMTKLIVAYWNFLNTRKNRNCGMDFEFCGLNNTLHSCMAIWIVKSLLPNLNKLKHSISLHQGT